jgi:hypothetical protein
MTIRPMERDDLHGEPAGSPVAGSWFSDPRSAPSRTGGRQMRICLDGPQKSTITDGATNTVRREWNAS